MKKRLVAAVAAVVLAVMPAAACAEKPAEVTPMERCLATEGQIEAGAEDAGLDMDMKEFCEALQDADPAGFDDWYSAENFPEEQA